ncbi:hypothetical protein ACFWVU_18465 [Streptomyces sp. NPDC058686]|uniref:hypothetical protein n=1 Tax=Streptomyces sp. NPDC058686 TaxID=3346599 RepID=UPI003654A1E1
MTTNATPRLLEPKGARAVFYKTPDLKTSEDRISVRLTYSARVLHYVIPAVPAAANGAAVGFALVATSDGSVRPYNRIDEDYLGLVERGPRGWIQRIQLERQARKRAKQYRNELKKSEQAAVIAAEILKESA